MLYCCGWYCTCPESSADTGRGALNINADEKRTEVGVDVRIEIESESEGAARKTQLKSLLQKIILLGLAKIKFVIILMLS